MKIVFSIHLGEQAIIPVPIKSIDKSPEHVNIEELVPRTAIKNQAVHGTNISWDVFETIRVHWRNGLYKDLRIREQSLSGLHEIPNSILQMVNSFFTVPDVVGPEAKEDLLDREGGIAGIEILKGLLDGGDLESTFGDVDDFFFASSKATSIKPGSKGITSN